LYVVVVVKFVEKFADFDASGLVELRVIFGEVTKFRGDDGPTIFTEPRGDGVHVFDARDEAGASVAFRDVIVGLGGDGFEIIGAGLDGGGLQVGRRDGMMGFDEADVIEKERQRESVSFDI
jgi:hypothetical protein